MSQQGDVARTRRRILIGWTAPIAVPLGLALWTSNPGLTVASLATLAALVGLTWRPGEPPILLFASGYQWIQVSTKIFHADILGVRVGDLLPYSRVEEAIWLSLAGLGALALGMRVGIVRLDAVDRTRAREEISRLSIERIWLVYLILFAGKELVRAIAWRLPGLTQILLSAAGLRWFFFFLFAYGVFGQRRRYGLLMLAVALEVVVGFTGFFSAFKEVFFVLAMAFLTARPRFGLRNAAVVGAVVAGVAVLGIFWMAVRNDYRMYVSEGERAQVIRVDFLERLKKMASMVMDVDRERLSEAVELFADRLAYVDYFGKVIYRVPSMLRFEDGALWKDAILHVLEPRLFFPDKPVLPSDSELTMKYTGEWLASGEEGTSISLGYFAESYIDFGPRGMMPVIFCVGLVWGLMYRYFLRRPVWACYAFSAAVTVLINANEFEIHNVKLVGGVLTTFIVVALWTAFGLPVAHLWMRKRRIRVSGAEKLVQLPNLKRGL